MGQRESECAVERDRQRDGDAVKADALLAALPCCYVANVDVCFSTRLVLTAQNIHCINVVFMDFMSGSSMHTYVHIEILIQIGTSSVDPTHMGFCHCSSFLVAEEIGTVSSCD